MTKFHTLTDARNPVVFTRLEALTPAPGQPGFYPGVLIIEKGPAKGHYAVQDGDRVVNFNSDNPDHAQLQKYPIIIGDAALDDVTRCGVEAENTKCKLDHGSTVRDIVGVYSSFRREGDQVRADLTLMVSSQYREYVEELFAKFSKKVGNSIDFDSSYEIQGNVAVSRCVKLYSVDIVDAPAATSSLFNEQINLPQTNMPLSKEDLEAITGVVTTAVETRFSALEKGINTRFDKIETTVTKLEEGDDEDDAEKKKKKKDEEDSGKEAMSEARIQKAVLAGIREVLPKATLDNLTSLAAKRDDTKDEYAEKVQLCEAAGLKGTQITRHIAAKYPTIYNTKFGNGGGQKGSAKS